MIILAQLHKYFTERDAKKANGKEFEIEGFADYVPAYEAQVPAPAYEAPAPTAALQVSTAMGSLKLEKPVEAIAAPLNKKDKLNEALESTLKDLKHNPLIKNVYLKMAELEKLGTQALAITN
jgi:hypothetical protein